MLLFLPILILILLQNPYFLILPEFPLHKKTGVTFSRKKAHAPCPVSPGNHWGDGVFHRRSVISVPQDRQAWSPGSYFLTHNCSAPARDPSLENNRRESRCLPESPVLPRWKKRLRGTGSVTAPQQSQGQIENCAVLMKVPRSLLSGLETIVHKRYLHKLS